MNPLGCSGQPARQAWLIISSQLYEILGKIKECRKDVEVKVGYWYEQNTSAKSVTISPNKSAIVTTTTTLTTQFQNGKELHRIIVLEPLFHSVHLVCLLELALWSYS